MRYPRLAAEPQRILPFAMHDIGIFWLDAIPKMASDCPPTNFNFLGNPVGATYVVRNICLAGQHGDNGCGPVWLQNSGQANDESIDTYAWR
jgi:hypothetical protein